MNRSLWKEHFQTPIFTLKSFPHQLPRSEKTKNYFVLESRDWVNVVPVTKEGDLLLIRQFRHGIGEESIEIPGGIVDEDGQDAPFLSAKRELSEETGYATEDQKWEPLAKFSGNPAMFTNWSYSFLALGVEKSGETSFDEGEDIECLVVSPQKTKEWIREGKIHHPHMVSAILLYFLKYQV